MGPAANVKALAGRAGREYDGAQDIDMNRSLKALALILTVAPFAGCGGKTPMRPQPAAVDTSAITAAITLSGLDADALFPAGEVSMADSADLKTGTLVAPVAFRRTIARADYGYGYTFSETDAAGRPLRVVALRCKYQKGMLQLVKQYAPDDPTPADSSDRLVDKVMDADWMRNIELRRANGNSPWIVRSVSEVLLIVDDKRVCADCHAEIEEVRLQSGAVDVTLTGNALALDTLIRVAQGRTTTVTARSRNDAHVVLLTDALGTRIMRRIAPNVFSAAMATGAPGLRHFTVEALSDSSLFDDTVRVSQHGWTILYSVDP